MNAARLVGCHRFSWSARWVLSLVCLLVLGSDARALVVGPSLSIPTVTGGALDPSLSPRPSISLISSPIGSNLGLTVTGDFRFTADGSSPTAGISYVAIDLIYLTAPFTGQLNTLLDGNFWTINGGSASLTDDSVMTTLTRAGNPSWNLDFGYVPTPVTIDSSHRNLTVQESTPVSLTTGFYTLTQTVNLTFSVASGIDTDIHVDFPNTSQLTSVPEPSTLAQFSTGGVFTFLVLTWLRWKRSMA